MFIATVSNEFSKYFNFVRHSWRRNSLGWRQIENVKDVLLLPIDINVTRFSQIYNQGKLLLATMTYFLGLLSMICIISVFLILIGKELVRLLSLA